MSDTPLSRNPFRRSNSPDVCRPDRPRRGGGKASAANPAELVLGIARRRPCGRQGSRRRTRPPGISAQVARPGCAGLVGHEPRRLEQRQIPDGQGAGMGRSWPRFQDIIKRASARPGQELWGKLPPGTAISHQLSRLFHYASAQGIEPRDMNDEVLASFHRGAGDREHRARSVRDLRRGAAKSLEQCRRAYPRMAATRVSACRRANDLSPCPGAAFPPTLEADVEVYLRRAAGLDLER